MNENIKLFLQKIATDSELAAKMQDLKTADEAYEFASSIQDGFTKEEFFEAMEKIKTAAEGQELSDEDLAKLAGGEVSMNWETTVSFSVSAATAGSALASVIHVALIAAV